MSDASSRPAVLDFASIEDPSVRRAMQALQQHLNDALARQQIEIDAMLELMLEKHITSLSEFKRQVVRLQQDTTRSSRIHGAMTPTPNPAPGTPH
ncbi:MAG: hypothetical protein ACM359_19935 [Bacillota bacterium]